MDAVEDVVGLRPFDQVRLKTGGPLMTVVSSPEVNPVRCRFNAGDGGGSHYEFHPAAELEKSDEESPERAEKRKRDEAFQRLKDSYPDLIPANFHFECGQGWIGVLTRYFDEVRSILPEGPKFRLIRIAQRDGPVDIDTFPPEGASEEVEIALSIAEKLADSRSLRVCESCGERGYSRPGGWITVSCDQHSHGSPRLPPELAVFTIAGVRYVYDEPTDSLRVLSQAEADAIPWLCD